MKNEHNLFRYEEISDKIQSIIKNLNLGPGDRIPSIRQICKELNTSLTTALKAFHILEARGLIVSRPQSGYFVNSVAKNNLARRYTGMHIPFPSHVALSSMITSMLKTMKEFGLVNFFIFAPPNELLPISRISKAIRDSLKDTTAEGFQYPLIEGHPRLVKQIARQTFDWTKSLSTDDILVTNGCMEAINLCLDAVTKPGDIVLVESPTAYGILQSLEFRKLLALEVISHPETGLDLSQLEMAIKKHKVAACIASVICNAPMGSSMPKENIIGLLKILNDNNIPLIEDDALGELCFTQPRPLPAKAYDNNNNVLYCTSFSKTLGPGLRIGWVSGGKYHDKLKGLKYMSNFFTNGILQDAIGRFLETGLYNSHVKRLNMALQQNMVRYVSSIHQYFPQQIKMSIPKGGLSLWIELPASIDALDLQRRAIKQGIGIFPGQIFSTSKEYDNYIRLNYCLLWNLRIDKYLQKLGIILKQYKL